MQTIKTKNGTTVSVLKTGYRYRAYKHNKAVYFPLGMDKGDALKLADDIRNFLKFHSVEDARLRFHPDYKVKDDGNVVTWRMFSKYVRSSLRSVMGWSKATVDSYLTSFAKVIKFGSRLQNIDKFNVREFDARWLRDLKVHTLSLAEDEEDEFAKKRTYNATLRCIKSLFADEAVECFGDKRWFFAFVDEVRGMAAYKRVKKVWVAPDENQIHAVHKFVANLEGDQYVAAALALYSGLRLKEILFAERTWIQRAGSELRMWVAPCKGFTPKGKVGYTCIDPTILCRINDNASTTTGRFLPDRGKLKTLDELREVLRAVLPVAKPIHELRRLFGTYVTNRFDLWRAQQYLRHESPQTTFDSYADSILSEGTMQLWEP